MKSVKAAEGQDLGFLTWVFCIEDQGQGVWICLEREAETVGLKLFFGVDIELRDLAKGTK